MGLLPPPCCLTSHYLTRLTACISDSYISGFVSRSLEEAYNALNCTRMRLVDIKNLVPLTELCFPEHCNTTMRAARSAASCPVATTVMANSKFHYFSSLLVYYPEYCQIITEHAACVAWKHIPNTKGKYYISKGRVQMKQGAQCNCLAQGNGSFHDAALKRGSLTLLHKVGLSNQAIGLFPSCFERCKRGRHKRKARRI